MNNVEYVNVKKRKTISKRNRKKILYLFFLMGLTSGLLITSTYAWFIGLSTATVNTFELNVTSGDQLELSLDANTWSDTLTITEAGIVTAGYEGNKNHASGTNGLVPVSTAGELNKTVGRLKLFSKSSLTGTAGGYRLLSDAISNEVEEQDGYLVFDLFIRNGTGVDYIQEYNELDDEDIYLSKNSSVVSAPSGGSSVDDYGIANSVRVAFMQIGRIAANGSSKADVVGITCSDDSAKKITNLCNKGTTTSDNGQSKTWNIWEPNDGLHDSHLISHFNRLCKKRTLATGTYTSEACLTLTSNYPIDTYVVNKQITSGMNVDIYDGINGFSPLPDGYALSKSTTFTDTEKNKTGVERQSIFKLAANSITKVRVYIYIEGQDIDNYDLIANGEKIKVNFGFTRDRYDLAS